VIVAIQRSTDYVFVDATSTHQRGSLINLYISDYGKALVLKQGELGFANIEPEGIDYTEVREELTVRYPGEGTSTLKVITDYNGGVADNIRNYLATTSRAEMAKQYERYYADIYDSIKLSGEMQITDDSIHNTIRVEENYTIPKLWSNQSDGKEQFPVYV